MKKAKQKEKDRIRRQANDSILKGMDLFMPFTHFIRNERSSQMNEHEVVISFERLASLIEAQSMLKAIEKYLSQKKDFNDSDANVLRSFLESRKGE